MKTASFTFVMNFGSNFFYLRIIDIIRLLFHSRRVNEIVYSSKQFSNYCTLSNSIIDKSGLYECFMKRHDELIERLPFSFSFIVCFFKNQWQSLKNEFCITNVLCHLLFWSRSPNSKSQYRLCSRVFVENASDFVSSNKYNFSLIYTDNEIFIKKTELLFTQLKCMRFNLDVFFRLKCTLSLLILNRIVVWTL